MWRGSAPTGSNLFPGGTFSRPDSQSWNVLPEEARRRRHHQNMIEVVPQHSPRMMQARRNAASRSPVHTRSRLQKNHHNRSFSGEHRQASPSAAVSAIRSYELGHETNNHPSSRLLRGTAAATAPNYGHYNPGGGEQVPAAGLEQRDDILSALKSIRGLLDTVNVAN